MKTWKKFLNSKRVFSEARSERLVMTLKWSSAFKIVQTKQSEEENCLKHRHKVGRRNNMVTHIP